ncbi:MerR family transcriptional regulator [Sphingobium sp. Ant17]|nr:MerR family transcriptional regulator [Sphingobium sp. Ant17]
MQNFRIGELAGAAGVRRDTIRYYERTGLLPSPQRTAAGYRLYDGSDLRRIKFIRSAQKLGFTLSETQTLLELQNSDTARASDILAVTLVKLRQAEAKVSDLNTMREILERLAAACPGDADKSECPILAFLSSDNPFESTELDNNRSASGVDTTY